MEDSIQAPQQDLQAILASLAQYGMPTSNGSVPADGHQQATSPAELRPELRQESNGSSVQPASARVENLLRPQSRTTASPKPMIDPASITTWQEGLRCVTKIAAQNSAFADSIRRVSQGVSLYYLVVDPLTCLVDDGRPEAT